MTIAGPKYRNPDACHGPCYVLDTLAYELGERVVLEIIPPKNPPVKKPRKEPEKRLVTSKETRRVVVWVPGRAWDFKIIDVPVRAPEPVWASRARELRAFGWSDRKIAEELGISRNKYLTQILNNAA